MKKMVVHLIIFMIVSISVSMADILAVPVEGVIDGGLAAFIRRSISVAENENAEGIIFHIDTPGGRVDSAVDIKDAILNTHIPTIAFIDKNAISAGSLISMACDSIYMSKGSSIGAATAVDLQGNKAPEKMISYFRAQMRATAEAKGRRPDIAEAMVDDDIAIENITVKGKLLTLTYTEALSLDISDGTVETLEEVLVKLGKENSAVMWIRLNWAENVVRFFTHPIVSSLLLSLGLLGLIIEIKTPGWGIGGTIALIALTLFFGSHYIVRLAGIGELLLFATGIILLIIEIFLIPGFGIAGVSGIGLILVSLYLSLVGRMPAPDDFARAAYTIGGAFAITIIGTLILIRLLPHTSVYRKLVLSTVESSSDGYRSAENMLELIGSQGIALSALRPAGKAEIDGRRLDVVTEGEYIEKGLPVVVTDVHGSRIVVKQA